MNNSQKAKTKISYFYLIKRFPIQTFFHYLTGFLSAFAVAKLLARTTGFVNNKNKNIDISFIRNNFWEVIGLLIIFYGIIVLLHIAMEIWLVEVYSSHLRQKISEKYLTAKFPQTQKAHFVLSNYENEAINAGTKAAQIFNRCFHSVVGIFLVLWGISKNAKESWLVPWLLFALLILTITGLLLYQLAYRPRFQRTKDIQKENKHFEELKENIEYIKITGAEKKEIQKNNKLLEKNLKSLFPLVSRKSFFATIPNYLMLKTLPLPFLLIASKRGVESVSLFLLYTKLVVFFGEWKKFFEELWAKGGYDSYCSSLNELNKGFATLEKDNSYSPSMIKSLPTKKINIDFQKVSFTYPETNKKILDKFSFNFQEGKKYAIFGPNGIGKSTLFKLIAKLYRPQEGTIKLDNTELEKIDSLALRGKIIYLPNHPYFFDTSLGDNVVYPDSYQENVHKEKLENVAKKLGIEEFINNLPNGWETIIAEKGRNLSEGQKQLISLMRAFVRDYEIYLFDEFLSNVSSDRKEKILEVVFRKLRDKTVIVISHDPEVLSYLDETYKFTSHKLIKDQKYERN